MTEILFGTPNSKTKGSLGLLLKISTENPDCFKSQSVAETKVSIRWAVICYIGFLLERTNYLVKKHLVGARKY